MRYAHEVAKVRAAEEALMARSAEGALMRRAAAGLAAVCGRLLPRVYGSRVVLLIGGGDNGGDALYAGARLAARGARVDAVLAARKVHERGLAALRGAGGRVIDAADAPADAADGVPAAADAVIDRADLLIDGLTGIGGKGGLREPYATLARRTAQVRGLVVACDVPSGVDAGTGEVAGAAVTADVTVTFGTYKPGLLIDPGAAHSGIVELVDIGLAGDLPDPDVVAYRAADVQVPAPHAESDKYRRGVVGVLAGSERFTGAAVLATGGAVHGGAGMVRVVSVRPVIDLVRQRWPEAVTTVIEPIDGVRGDGGLPGTAGNDAESAARALLESAGQVQAWVAGPGLGTDAHAEALLAAALGTTLPVLVDADGLTVLARRRDLLSRPAPTVLTPHAGELARLISVPRQEIEARRLHHVRQATAELAVTVLLKGSTTLIAEPARPVRVNPTGTGRLATAGTGDVLSGLIGALLAAGMAAIDAAAAGAFLHGLAARLAAAGPMGGSVGGSPGGSVGGGQAPISAHDVIMALPEAFRTVQASAAPGL